MRAMIVAAGLGTRMQPLTQWLPKPAVPVRGVPLIASQLELLAAHGAREVVINTHHLPEALMEAAREWCPAGMTLEFSIEKELLDTGGGIRRAAAFLRESDPCLVIGGDMLLDADLTALCAAHREQDNAATFLLRRDPRMACFGSVGVDEEGCVRRIGDTLDLGGECDAGLYVWANVFSPRLFDSLPELEVFSHLRDWIGPRLEAGARDVRGVVTQITAGAWEPVGTLEEYLAVNLSPPRLGYFDADAAARERGVRFEPGLVIGAGATLGAGASLRDAVVWHGEHVPPGFEARGGVFAAGAFHPCPGANGAS